MKQIIVLQIIFFLIVGKLNSQISGIEFIFTNNGIEVLEIPGEPVYNSFEVTWTDSQGNIIKVCNDICGLTGPDIKPGRYCVTIEADDILPLACYPSEFASISKCFDLEGSTCPELTGSMVKSDITCMQNASGFVSWQGELAPCLADNAQFSWSTGDLIGITNLL